MKKLVSISVIILFFVTGSIVYADQFGPIEPSAREGQVSLGTGYSRTLSKWKSNNAELNSLEIGQNKAYLQLGYGFAKNWESYLRLGGADIKTDMTLLTQDFKDGIKPFGTLGIKGLFYDTPSFGIGPFVQASLYSTYKDEETNIFYVSGLPIGRGTLKVKFKKPWDINLGLNLQTKISGAILYGGPIAYWARCKVEKEQIAMGTTQSSFTIKEKGNIGGFAGFRLPVGKVNLEVEGQLKSRISISTSLSYSF